MTDMKFSAPDWCFLKSEYKPADYYNRLKAMGYDGVEMLDPANYEAARGAGLAILNMSGPGMQKGLNRLENHGTLIPEIRQAISHAQENNIPHVIVFSGNREGQPNEEGIANCERAFKELVSDAESAGVALAFEMLNSFDHADYQADGSAYGFELARRLGSPAFKVVYDIYHMERMGESALEDIPANLNHIAHLHVAGSPKRDFPGADQDIDYREIVKCVREAGYSRYWGQEFMPGSDPLAELEKARELLLSYC